MRETLENGAREAKERVLEEGKVNSVKCHTQVKEGEDLSTHGFTEQQNGVLKKSRL